MRLDDDSYKTLMSIGRRLLRKAIAEGKAKPQKQKRDHLRDPVSAKVLERLRNK